MTIPQAETWFYLSFADAELPEGQQFLGGVYIPAETELEALLATSLLGINPGGSVVLVGPFDSCVLEEFVMPEDRGRLLTAEEVGPGEYI